MKVPRHFSSNNINHHDDIKVLFKNNILNFVVSMIGVFSKVLSTLGFSTFVQKILDTISGTNSYNTIYLIVYALVCFTFMLLGAVIEYFYWTAFREKALAQYREHIYNNILSKHISTFDNENTSLYIASMSNDLDQIKDNYIESLPYMVELILSFIGTVILMLYYNIQLALIAFGISIIPIIVSSIRLKDVELCEEKLSTANGDFLGAFVEVLHGFKTIKCMRSEKSISARLLSWNKNACLAFRNREHIEISVSYIASITGYIAQIAFFFISMILSQHNPLISVGIIIAFVQLMQNISQLAIAMPELIARVKAGKKLIQKNNSYLMMHQSNNQKIVNLTCKNKIELSDLSVYRSGIEILHNLSLSFFANACYAIIGESGSGKSTLINTLTGANRDYTGHIKIDGTDIKDISSDSLFQLMTIIYQDVFIFNATIKENITLFNTYDDTLLSQAICKAGLSEIIEDKGWDYICGENGSKLSGGERQRIGIARSILSGAEVYFFDEITSALDTQTSHQIINTIQNMRNKTRIVIIHDIFTDLMENFDCLFIMKNGKIVESGKYDELIVKKGELYKLLHKQ